MIENVNNWQWWLKEQTEDTSLWAGEVTTGIWNLLVLVIQLPNIELWQITTCQSKDLLPKCLWMVYFGVCPHAAALLWLFSLFRSFMAHWQGSRLLKGELPTAHSLLSRCFTIIDSFNIRFRIKIRFSENLRISLTHKWENTRGSQVKTRKLSTAGNLSGLLNLYLCVCVCVTKGRDKSLVLWSSPTNCSFCPKAAWDLNLSEPPEQKSLAAITHRLLHFSVGNPLRFHQPYHEERFPGQLSLGLSGLRSPRCHSLQLF